MGLEKAGILLNDEVFVRTELGALEVENVSGSALSREARTLLILIDGRKSYAQVTRLLENRKMFRNTGGLKQHLQMLIELDYVNFSSSELVGSNDEFSEIRSEHSEITLFTKAYEPYHSVCDVDDTEVKDEDEDKDTKYDLAQGRKKTIRENHAVEQLRSIMLALISKHGEKSMAEKCSEKLKMCQSLRCIFGVIQKLRNESSGQFEVALTMAARAFKNSKVA